MSTILLVDDEPAITDNLAPLLRRAGFEVVVAHDGDQALARLRAAAPDLVVLDVLLPGMDGRAVLRQVRQERREVPIILLTQVGESGRARDGPRGGRRRLPEQAVRPARARRPHPGGAAPGPARRRSRAGRAPSACAAGPCSWTGRPSGSSGTGRRSC